MRYLATLAVLTVVAGPTQSTKDLRIEKWMMKAPVVYSPTEVYVGVSLQPSATYPNWHSLSCWAFGIGTYYGSWYENGSYQFGCQPPPF